MTREDVNAMFGHMGLSSGLDANDSPGAQWLQSLHDAMQEAWDERRFDSDEPSDVISELADSAVPVYTHHRWQVFLDTCAYDDEDTDEASDRSSPTEWAGRVLYFMASRAMHNWLEEKRESEEEDADDDED